jgi:hypothetical protein
MVVSQGEEVALGEQSYKQVLKESKIETDPRVGGDPVFVRRRDEASYRPVRDSVAEEVEEDPGGDHGEDGDGFRGTGSGHRQHEASAQATSKQPGCQRSA